MPPVAAEYETMKLGHDFYSRGAVTVARDLIGKILVRRTPEKVLRARITETEAYRGPRDLAAHSSKGRTKRNEVMFGPAGHAYVFFIYGMHEMLNVVVGTPGAGQAVLLRGAVPLDGWDANLSGPGRLARGFGVKMCENGLDLGGDSLWIEDNPGYRPRIIRTKRIGVEYAKEWKDALLRFVDASAGVQ